MYQRPLISFRPLEQDDLPQMYHWLRNPEVAQWYGPSPESLAEVEGKYLARINGEIPVSCYVVNYDHLPVAYIQSYPIAHDPDYASALNVDRDAVGVDLFIGDNDFRHRGFGSVMLQEFVKRIVFSDERVSCCIIAPSVSNHSAIRAYQKAGFRHIKTVRVPGEDEPEYVMILWPDEIAERIAELESE